VYFGFRWSPFDERACARIVPALRAARRLSPDQIALWPEARA
jgi:hypothetical protein